MKTLCMDSAHRHLVLVLAEEGKTLASCALSCWKRQSETIFPKLEELMQEVHWTPDDIDEVVITDGPGSYTGVRIAMTIAKVFCTRKHVRLYTISTLQLYAGLCEKAFVMLDARSARAYCGIIEYGVVKQEKIMSLADIKTYLTQHPERTVFGDCELIEQVSAPLSFVENFMALRAQWQEVENIHILTPRYLKEQDAYKVK